MAKQTINIGSSANDGTGTSLRDGGDLINDNFNEIYTAFGDGSTLSSGFVTATGTATLTNKTLTSPVIDTITRTGDFTIDASGDIKLDAAGGDVEINNNGTVIGKLSDSSNDFQLTSIIQDKDFVVKGNDGGSFVTALRLDMSEAGAAIFNSTIAATGLTINSAYTFPTADGGANQVLQTNGSGTLSFAALSGLSNVVEDTSPQLGGNLDLNSNDITGTGNIDNVGTITTDGLTVAGSITLAGNYPTGSGNVVVGCLAGNSIGGSAASNTFIGNRAATNSDHPAINNVAVGHFALACNTAGPDNTAVGSQAIQSATGTGNVGLGRCAGHAITSGSNNIVIGTSAAASSATVSNEITLGNSSVASLRIPGLQSGASQYSVLAFNNGTDLALAQITSCNFDSAVCLQILDSSGSVLKTIFSPGS